MAKLQYRSVSKRTVEALSVEKGTPTAANEAVGVLSRMLNQAEAWGLGSAGRQSLPFRGQVPAVSWSSICRFVVKYLPFRGQVYKYLPFRGQVYKRRRLERFLTEVSNGS